MNYFKIFFFTAIAFFFSLSYYAQEITSNDTLSSFDQIKSELSIEQDLKCDTLVVGSKNYYTCPISANKKLFIAKYTGREYIEGEGPKILFKTERYLIENDTVITSIHEKEHYHFNDKISKEKTERKWEATYELSEGNIKSFKELASGKDKRASFSEQDILETYKKHIKRIKKTRNEAATH